VGLAIKTKNDLRLPSNRFDTMANAPLLVNWEPAEEASNHAPEGVTVGKAYRRIGTGGRSTAYVFPFTQRVWVVPGTGIEPVRPVKGPGF